MPVQDEWGHDPSVRSMRRVFARFEMVQTELLRCLNISFFDARLRRIREEARRLFEYAWERAARRGILSGEEDIVSLYAHCLAQALSRRGVDVPQGALPDDKRIVHLLQEGQP